MRRHITLGLGLIVALAFSATSAWAADEDLRAMIRDEIALSSKADDKSDGNTFKVYWKDGLRLDTANKKVKLKIGGRVMFDTTFYSDSEINAPTQGGLRLSDGVEFRRVRLYNAGQIGKHVEYKVQFDFAHGTNVGFRDVYVGINHLRDCFGCGAPNIRAGHFFEPFSLEQVTSSKYITFMTRAAPVLVFAPERSSGFMLHDTFRGGQLGYAVGLFSNSTMRGIDLNPISGLTGANVGAGDGSWSSDGWGVTGRVWWVPWYDCNCACKRLHLGLSYTHREALSGLRLRGRGAYHIGSSRLIDTSAINADSLDMIGAELAWVYGPWSVQAEYIHALPQYSAAGIAAYNATALAAAGGATASPTFSGYYAYVSYWLTGECRNYTKGHFGRTKPCCNFLDKECCCKGGVELAARFSRTDLTDSGIRGGEMSVVTLGVNWHLNPNMRIMLNAAYHDVSNRAFTTAAGPTVVLNNANVWAYSMRWQVDF